MGTFIAHPPSAREGRDVFLVFHEGHSHNSGNTFDPKCFARHAFDENYLAQHNFASNGPLVVPITLTVTNGSPRGLGQEAVRFIFEVHKKLSEDSGLAWVGQTRRSFVEDGGIAPGEQIDIKLSAVVSRAGSFNLNCFKANLAPTMFSVGESRYKVQSFSDHKFIIHVVDTSR